VGHPRRYPKELTMGCEGDFNLDNDAAGDLLAEISDELFERVVELLQHPRGHEYDDEEIAELFVRIEMIFALHAQSMINSAPAPAELRSLISPYFKRWTDYHEAQGHSMPCKRSETMTQTFDRLVDIASEIY